MTKPAHLAELDTRARILESARALMLKREGAEVSMAEIGRAAGVSRQAVYLHFADRGDLYVALFQYVDEKRGLAQEVERLSNAPTAIAALRGMASLQARTNPDLWPLARAADVVRRTDEAVEKAWQDRVKDRHFGCKALVKRLAKEGALRKDIKTEVATDLLWSITSLRVWEDLVIQRKWSAEQYERHISELLIRVLVDGGS